MIKSKVPENGKEKKAKFSFRITVRNAAHFYKIVNWLNAEVGKGSDKWTMEGRTLKLLKEGKTISRVVYIFADNFEESSASYLSLL